MAPFVASEPGFLYYYPWESWGNFKYLLYAPVVVKAWQVGVMQGTPLVDNVYFHMLALAFSRYLMFQVWGTLSRLPCVSRKHQIQTKGIKFEQIDHEANWESTLIMATYMFWISSLLLFPEGLPMWDWKGVAIAFLVHAGPVEWIYYWAHRALHHHFLFTRYHQHHHSSFVTQPITSTNHPLLELSFYLALFGLAYGTALLVGHGSFGLFYIYTLFVDHMNAWGHCNFEFIPTWVFDALPPLKYIIYSPTYHSLHHTKVHTNFCLFMPLYDYIYGTVDATTDGLHQEMRKGHEAKVDCVYLTHATELLSTFHLQFGFQTFAAQPYCKKWYMWIMWPIALPLMLTAWLFAKPFVGATHFIGNKMELQTWVIPRFSFQYSLHSETRRINGWIQECILQAQQAGAKVIALALLNKWKVQPTMHIMTVVDVYQDRKLDIDEVFMCKKGVCIPIVTGDTLAAAIVAKEVEAKQDDAKRVFITSAHSRIGRAISTYLCEHGFRVLALLPSKHHAENLRERIAPEFRENLVYSTNYDAGKSCKVWIVGEQIGRELQRLAPRGAHFHQYTVFPIHKWREDCTYGGVPGLRLPDNAQNVNACEDVMPRYVVRASYAAVMVHALEEWQHHDFGDDITTELMNESWEAASKHGFATANEDQMTKQT